MKKIILILCVELISCGTSLKETEVISLVKYYARSGYYYYETSRYSCFYSKRLIYNVGDTVKFTK